MHEDSVGGGDRRTIVTINHLFFKSKFAFLEHEGVAS